MAQTRWLLNDTSVAVGATWQASNSNYYLTNIEASTLSRTTSSPLPYEGAGCYQGSQVTTDANMWSITKNIGGTPTNLNGETGYIDLFLYCNGSDKYITPISTGNDSSQQYTWVNVNTNNGKMGIYTFGTSDSPQSQTRAETASGQVPSNEWFRIVITIGAKGPVQANLFKGTNILEYYPDATVSWSGSTYSTYQWLYGGAGNADTYFDDVIYDTQQPDRGAPTTYKRGYGIVHY